MLLRGLIPLSVILLGIFFAAVEASSHFSLPIEKTTSCGRVELQQCWCLEENPCDSHKKSKKIDSTDVIPIISKKNIVTAETIKKYIYSGSPTKLSLAGYGFEGIDKNAFDNFTDLKSLDLSTNHLNKLPAFIFSKLTNLESLDLFGNGMKTTRKLFAGLTNLKKLYLRENAMNEVLEDNCFFGLGKSCEIHVTPNTVKKLATDAFGNEPSASVQDPTKKAINEEDPKKKVINEEDPKKKVINEEDPTKKVINEEAPKAKSIDTGSTRPRRHIIGEFKICIKNNIVQQVDQVKGLETLEEDCIELNPRFSSLYIENLGIFDFKKGWYRLQDKDKVPYALSVLRIVGNNMPTVSKNVVNDLPDYITWLEMTNNKIERLEKGTFEHNHIFSLELNDNLIAEIEDNAFKMPKLYQLFLRNNRLKDTKFMATMPASLSSIDLENNEIEEISPNSFSNLKELRWVSFQRNRIIKVGIMGFYGATKLGTIILSMNNITTISPGAFSHLRLGALSLRNNEISTIENGVFNSYVDVQHLSLSGNKLKKITSGLFDLPTVERLDLSKNQIIEIEKSAMKGLGRLTELDLSSNLITELENGALFGLNKVHKCYVLMDNTPVKKIHGGVFDDV